MKYTKNLVREMLKENYQTLYYPMPQEIRELFPVVTIDIASDVFGIHFTTKHSGKMSGMVSLSTTCKVSEKCRARIEKAFRLVMPEFSFETATTDDVKRARALLSEHIKTHPECKDVSVCGFCFSYRQQDFMPSMTDPLARNHDILNNGIIHPDWLPIVNAAWARGESFGDFSSTNAVINFLNLIAKNPHCFFGVWSKNPNLFHKVFGGDPARKPVNMKMILSSQFINKRQQIPAQYGYFVDAVFTVYTETFAETHDININCGARACLVCLKCYQKNGVAEISELLK